MPVCNTVPRVNLARKKGTSHLLFLGGGPGVAAHRMRISMMTRDSEVRAEQQVRRLCTDLAGKDAGMMNRMATSTGKPPACR